MMCGEAGKVEERSDCLDWTGTFGTWAEELEAQVGNGLYTIHPTIAIKLPRSRVDYDRHPSPREKRSISLVRHVA